MEDIKVSHVICNIFYDFVNFLLIMIFPKIWIVNNTCHRSKHAKNFGYRWWLSCIFFFLVKFVLLLLCCICQVIFLRLFDDSWVNLSNKWKQRRGLVVGAWTFFFIWNHLNSISSVPVNTFLRHTFWSSPWSTPLGYPPSPSVVGNECFFC